MIRAIFLTIILLFAQSPHHSQDLTVTYKGKILLKTGRSELVNPLTSLIDRQKYHRFEEQVGRSVSKAPVNAKIDHQGAIVPSRTGYSLNHTSFKDRIYRYYFGEGSATVNAPLLKTHPDVDEELLAHIRVQRIGHYITFFNSGNKNRAHNIHLAATALDNHVIFPNEIFSFNKTVGMRTRVKGYQSAPIIVRGEYSEGIGGGICQVSTTLFNAADRAGLKIIERYSHSKRVAYVPDGRDATVSWYGPDLRFKNTYNQPILIRAFQYGGSVAFTLYSSDVINIAPRRIPNASKHLPKEIHQPENKHSFIKS
ncbi:VanW family protein [Sporolactobacillus sp. CPB3-1]|uniref:VanW family protein n=1 Tax=Sporolactobacillus mangiferae TaxID=2940498 RepID=A0ABT0MB40_9BACL|nr:VanW family protein [Sporolactobacillus mangiferae]MCL1632088.1 VanW family protein [Sporolactobacillus mangiferae]